MNIIFAGTPEIAVPSLQAILGSDHNISLVLTRSDSEKGRKKITTPSPVAEFAQQHALPLLKTNELNKTEQQILSNVEADIGIVVAYGCIFTPEILSIPRLGWINLHFSDLPQWRGAAPAQWTIRSGQKTSALTVFKLVEALDAGEIIERQSFSIDSDETVGELLSRLSFIGADVISRVLEKYVTGEVASHPQVGEVSYAPKLSLENAHLDFSLQAEEVYNLYRSVTPEPGAYIFIDGVRLKILKAKLLPNRIQSTGIIIQDGKKIILGLKDGCLVLHEVQPFGKKPMLAQSWWNGLRVHEIQAT